MSTLKATSPGAITGSIGSTGFGTNSISSGGAVPAITTAAGTGSYYLTLPVGAGSFGNGDFTLEGWINLGASGASQGGPKFTVTDEAIVVSFIQVEQNQKVRATLNPDTHLSTMELLRLNVLLAAGSDVTHPLSYIRAHSLERHFLFEAVQ